MKNFGIPDQFIEKIEFDKILDKVCGFCLTEMARQVLLERKPMVKRAQIEEDISLLGEFMQSRIEDESIPIGPFQSIDLSLERLKIENAPLTEEQLFGIKGQLGWMEQLAQYFGDNLSVKYPSLSQIWLNTTYNSQLYIEIDHIMDERGAIRNNASPELVRISKSILKEERKLDQTFQRLIGSYRKNRWLSEQGESVRNGRRVFSISSEHKRKVKGIIHDDSATGKTSYIEPEEIIIINNQIIDLHSERKKEVYRILKEISARCRNSRSDLAEYQQVLISFDQLRARVLFGELINGVLPKIGDKPGINIRRAYHPLLWLKNKESGESTIPLDVRLKGNYRILLLSGPNAGGKSVALKTIGLLQYMIQWGLPVPVHEDSEFGLFDRICVDIGDQQSIEDDLSTYSSRLKLMNAILQIANEKTLILIDEFGSGTDPEIGGAIAASIMKRFDQLKVFGVITTHYGNLKMLANKLPHVVNGAMLFDQQSMKPMFVLRVGKPGSSFALEIAQKCGLPGKMLKDAKAHMGKQVYHVDRLLNELETEKEQLSKKLRTNREKASKLEQLIRNYDRMNLDLEVKRKKLKLEIKQKAQTDIYQDRKQIESLIHELRQEKNLAKAQEKLKELEVKQENLKKEVKELDHFVYEENSHPKKPIEINDFVKHKKSDWIGKVISFDRRNAVLEVGDIRVTVPVKELLHAREPLPIRPGKSVATRLKQSPFDFNSQLDIRGLKAEEAVRVVENFIDKAMIANVRMIKILHGKGSGALRKLVIEKLKEYPSVEKVYHPDPSDGGDGLTLAQFSYAIKR